LDPLQLLPIVPHHPAPALGQNTFQNLLFLAFLSEASSCRGCYVAMLSQTPGRKGRRYAALLLFILLSVLLWNSFGPDGPPPLPIPQDAPIQYIPSSRDWSTVKIYNPVDEIKSPPEGTPKQLYKVQLRSGSQEEADATTEARRRAIKNTFIRTWGAYRRYAWKADELLPKSKRKQTTFNGWGAQVVDALDGLWIMGLKDEFYEAVRVVAKIDWAKTDGKDVDLFEVTIRYLGGLIAAYDLSSEPVLLQKAVELGDTLYATFDTPNRLPPRFLNYRNAKKGLQQADKRAEIATIGSLSLEFTRLTQLTGDAKYYDATERIKQFFYRTQNESAIPGLWTSDVNLRDEELLNPRFSFGAGADSMYEYLPKMHALLGGLDAEYEQMAIQSLEAARDHLLYKPMTREDAEILYPMIVAIDRDGAEQRSYEMSHLACFAGGMYALAGRLFARDDFVDLGSRLTAGCVWAYAAFPTGLMPETLNFQPCPDKDKPCSSWEKDWAVNPRDLPEAISRVRDGRYLLRPEAIESVYYMWRITGDEEWREAAWRMWEAIMREAKTDVAFGSVLNVRLRNQGTMDSMETFWLGETVKYFYLIFQDDDVINLDDWVLNTEAHPFKRPKAAGSRTEAPATQKPFVD
jgi:mannosyl-oligosaccharide alpha-1,2-mannosidase